MYIFILYFFLFFARHLVIVPTLSDSLLYVIVSVAAIPIILTLVINYFQSSSTAQKNVSALNAALINRKI